MFTRNFIRKSGFVKNLSPCITERITPSVTFDIKTVFRESGYRTNDYNQPTFDEYRLKCNKNSDVRSHENFEQRASTMYINSFIAGVAGLYATKAAVFQCVMFMAADASVLASGVTEVAIGNIAEGRTLIVMWRGKPVFVYHREQKIIDLVRETDETTMRDPQKDEDRCQRPEWLVLIGICTHLGCVPTPNQGMAPGGFFCACHGSHFDGSGRILKGPAPLNMNIPPYSFTDDNTLRIG